MDEHEETPVSEPAHREPQAAQPAGIDITQLAERVYRLFVAEARLGQARGEHTGQRRND